MALFSESLRAALKIFLEEDQNSFIIGQDVVDPYGGAFKVTKSLSAHYPQKVIAAPISEAAIVGYSIGRAFRGHPAICEIMFGDFITLSMDQLINQGLKIQTMYGKRMPLPLVVRFPTGGYRGYGPTHSQSLESIFLQFPEINVTCPSLFDDPGITLLQLVESKGLSLMAEHKMLYPREIKPTEINGFDLTVESFGSIRERISLIRLTRNITRADSVGIISYGYLTCLAIEAMISAYIEIEVTVVVISCCTLSNRDFSEIWEDISRCSKIVIVQESPVGIGWSAMVEVSINKLFRSNSFPCPAISHIGTRCSTIPSALNLEREHLPSSEIIKKEILT